MSGRVQRGVAGLALDIGRLGRYIDRSQSIDQLRVSVFLRSESSPNLPGSFPATGRGWPCLLPPIGCAAWMLAWVRGVWPITWTLTPASPINTPRRCETRATRSRRHR